MINLDLKNNNWLKVFKVLAQKIVGSISEETEDNLMQQNIRQNASDKCYIHQVLCDFILFFRAFIAKNNSTFQIIITKYFSIYCKKI